MAKVKILRDSNKSDDFEYNIFYFLDGKNSFFIPKFQRSYVWDPNTNILDLVNDLKREINSINDEYFLGTIALSPTNKKPINELSIIDGQQRITTVLMIWVLVNVILDKENKSEYYKNFKNGKVFKNNNEIIKDLINVSKVKKSDALNLIKSNPILKKVYDILLNEIEDDKYEFWANDIFKKLYFAVIWVDKPIIEQTYENMNYKMITLTADELFKNKLYLLATNFSVNELEIDKLLSNLDNLKNKYYTKGVDEKDSGQITRAILSKTFNTLVTNPGKYNDFDYREVSLIMKNKIKSANDFKKFLEGFIVNCQNAINFIDDYKKKNNDNKLIYSALNQNNPLFLLLFDSMDRNNIKFKKLIEYTIQFSDKSSKSFFKHNLWVECFKIFELIESKEINKVKLKSDTWDRIIDTNIYNDSVPLTRLFLIKYEVYYTRLHNINGAKKTTMAKAIKIMESKDFDIEHIFDKKDFNISPLLNKKNQIGNLTIIEKELNREVAGKSYEEKINSYKRSMFSISSFSEINATFSIDEFNSRLTSYCEFLKEEYK